MSSPPHVENAVTETNTVNELSRDLDQLITEIKKFKENSAVSFYEIGMRLKLIKGDELFRQKGFSSFTDFLKMPEVDITTTLAERFMTVGEDEDLRKSLYLGSAKVTEILKLNPEQRKKILSEPIEINGEKKTVDDLSLNELRKVSQDFKRAGKMKCDRCGRWVDHLKELDGKFYGSGSKDSCYDSELEDRRLLEENAIPTAQFDNVLNDLKSTIVVVKSEDEDTSAASGINWLPESIYQVYGQFLQQYEKNSEELSLSQLEKEEEIISKLMNLLKSRLKDVKESLGLLENHTE